MHIENSQNFAIPFNFIRLFLLKKIAKKSSSNNLKSYITIVRTYINIQPNSKKKIVLNEWKFYISFFQCKIKKLAKDTVANLYHICHQSFKLDTSCKILRFVLVYSLIYWMKKPKIASQNQGYNDHFHISSHIKHFWWVYISNLWLKWVDLILIIQIYM